MKLPGKLPHQFLETAKQLIHETRMKGLEHGAAICRDNGTGEIFLHELCVGTECSIRGLDGLSCPPGSTKVGAFHTHPDNVLLWSWSDIASMIARDEQFSCLGAGEVPYILCTARKKELSDEEKERLILRATLFGVPPDFSKYYESAFFTLFNGRKVEAVAAVGEVARMWTEDIMKDLDSHFYAKLMETKDYCKAIGQTVNDYVAKAWRRTRFCVEISRLFGESQFEELFGTPLVLDCADEMVEVLRSKLSDFVRKRCNVWVS